jgi:DNA recombination protein RmuC
MLDYIIIGLLIVVIILLIIVICRKNNKGNEDLTERLGHFEANINREIGNFKFEFSKNLTNDFEKLNESVIRKLTLINDQVNERLDKNFEKSNRTFENILERLSKIDEAQKKIESLNSEIVSLQSVLTDKKTRGTFGEVNLEYILNNAFGAKKNGIYETQHKYSNGYVVDAILYAPSPLGTISIDSKFPLEHYQKMTDKTKPREERDLNEKMFVMDVKKHINDIAEKYIVPGETSDEAIMFLPAEAIFAEINAYHPELLEYAYSKKVWITGPTTLISTLSIISMILKNMERDKYAKVIHDELNKLSIEFSRYKERWDKLSKSVKSVNQSIDELNITSEKITKRFDAINGVDIDVLTNSDKKELLDVK